MASQRKPQFFSERFELPRVTSNLEKTMGWCSAQWKILLFCVKTIMKESRKFELARVKEKKKKEKHFDCFWAWLQKGLGWHWWAISLLLLHEWGQKTNFWPCEASISDDVTFFLVCMGSHWLRAVTIENLLMSRCGLSHESAENGYKSSWGKF